MMWRVWQSSATPTTPAPPVTPVEIPQSRHVTMLVISLGVCLLSVLLEVRQDQRVYAFGWSNWAAPETCFSRRLFGVSCPGCGLTRSLIDLAHGRWVQSWQHHRVGWLMGLAVLLQIPYRISALAGWWRPRHPNRALTLFGETLIFALILNWCWQVAGEFPQTG